MDWGSTSFGVPIQTSMLGGKDNAGQSEHSTCCQAKGNSGVYCFLKVLSISGTVISGDHYACAHGNAVKKADHQEYQISRGADSSQGITVQEISYDQGVRSVVELLEEVSKKQRESEHYDFFPYGA